jgi:hypothetical protein
VWAALVMRKSRVRIPQAAPGTQRSRSRAVRRTEVGAGSARLGGASQTVLVASSQVVEFGSPVSVWRSRLRWHPGWAKNDARMIGASRKPISTSGTGSR